VEFLGGSDRGREARQCRAAPPEEVGQKKCYLKILGKSGIREGSMDKTTLGAALVELALVELALAYGEREGVVGLVTDLGPTAEHAVLSFYSLSTATPPSASSLRSTGRHPGPPSTSSRPTTRWSSRVLRTLTDVHHRRPNHQDALLPQRMVPRVLHLWVRLHCRLHLH